MLTSLLGHVARWKARVHAELKAHWPDRHIRKFIAHNRRKYPRRDGARSVVLVGEYNWNPSIYIYSLVANDLCARTGARIETFYFSRKRDLTNENIYASFGARRGLDYGSAQPFETAAEQITEAIFSNLRTKWDVLKIRIDGMWFGDLIYDTYLRLFTLATVDLKDPRLRKLIHQAALIYFATKGYFDRNHVVGVFPDHTVYIKCGILVRVAFAHKVPVYILPCNPNFYILQLDPELSEGMTNVSKRWSYYKYKQIFAQLPPEQQQAGREQARVALEERLSGKIDTRVLVGHSAYGQASAERILRTSDKPKILMLLHDFCDSVHCFREMLFPDFYEWTHHLLAKAEETDFEWYVKPHPNSMTSEAKNATNAAVIAELKQRYPKMILLDAAVSNRQLVEEGVSAMFTVHGTAGHELAYLGVPVVNAGDNLHVAYDFNLTPKTVAEYDALIAQAGHLDRSRIRQDEVAEFYYMHYFFFHERSIFGVNPIDEAWRTAPDYLERSRSPEALGYFLRTETPEKLQGLAQCFEDFFGKKAPMLGGVQWATIGTG